MNFKIKRDVLLNALDKTTRAVSPRTPIPALTGIKFDLRNNRLTLTGSDTDLTIQTYVEQGPDLEIYDEGSVILSAKYIHEAVRKVDSEMLNIEIIDGFLTRITGNNAEFNLNGTDPVDYPQIDLMKQGQHFFMNAFTLKGIVNQTKFAASDKETKPILTGINLKTNNGKLECIATDSYRVAKKIVDLSDDVSFNVTIPKKSLDDVSRIIVKDEDIEIYIAERKALFVFDQNIIQTRLIDGNYPDINRLIPKEFLYVLTVDANLLLGGLDRVNLVLSEQSNICKLDMNEDRTILSSYSQEIGSVEDTITNAFFKGDPLKISFSSKYLSEAIRAFNSTDKITLSLNGEMKPFIVKKYDSEDVIQLVLPVRTY